MKTKLFETRLPVSAVTLLLFLVIFIACSESKENKIVAVAPTKMNVFYLGVDNPVSIAVSGVRDADINASIDNGVITKAGDFYIAKPNKAGIAKISVIVKGKTIGTPEFRVKMLPDPIAKVLNMNGGAIDKKVLLTAQEVTAELEGSDFNAPFTVSAFTVSVTSGGNTFEKRSSSNRIDSTQLKLIALAKKGMKVYFQDIKATGPDGSIRNIGTILFEVK